MEYIATATLSSKGEIIIPSKIRKKLKAGKDAQFLMYRDKDLIILKVQYPPSKHDFDDCIRKMRKKLAIKD